MSNVFIAFKELVIAHNEIKLLHSLEVRQLQGTVSIRILVTQNRDNGKFFSNIGQKLPCFFHSQNVAFLGFVIFKHRENSHLQTFHNPARSTNMCIAAPLKSKLINRL